MAFLRWLHDDRKVIPEVPKAPKILIDEHAPVLLSAETRDAILAAIPEDRRGIFLALAYMGLRSGEARVLNGSDYRDGYLTISRAAKDHLTEGRVAGTKTRRVRRLPVDPDLADWIERHVPRERLLGSHALFQNPLGQKASKRWNTQTLNNAWEVASIKAVGRKIAPLYEGTRHTFATLALNSGAAQYVVQKFLGHTHSKTTERYAKLSDSALVTALKPSTDCLRSKTDAK